MLMILLPYNACGSRLALVLIRPSVQESVTTPDRVRMVGHPEVTSPVLTG
jgi:hypothetical protein